MSEVLRVAYMTAYEIHIISRDESDPLSPDAVEAMRAVLEAAAEVCTFCEHLLADHDAYGCQARRCDCMPESVRV